MEGVAPQSYRSDARAVDASCGAPTRESRDQFDQRDAGRRHQFVNAYDLAALRTEQHHFVVQGDIRHAGDVDDRMLGVHAAPNSGRALPAHQHGASRRQSRIAIGEAVGNDGEQRVARRTPPPYPCGKPARTRFSEMMRALTAASAGRASTRRCHGASNNP